MLIDRDDLRGWFAADSPLAGVVTGFAPRAGQADMADAVAAAIADRENLVVEAGTGTGKTLAYLVPALLAGRRIIVSTGTKTLQDQLFHRDLPMVCSALGRPATTVLLKGRANYLCLHRLETARIDAQGLARELALVEQWGQQTRSGDIAEAAGVPEDSPLWSRVTSTAENCVGTQCDFYSRCHVVTARKAAMDADIVVVNHHLLLADMVLKEEGFGELLPGAEAVIVDEAHQFPEIAQGFFNRQVSSRLLLSLAEDLRSEALRALPPARTANSLADKLLKIVADIRLALPREGSNVPWDDVAKQLDPLIDELILQLDDVIDWLGAQDEGIAPLRRCLERARGASELLAGVAQGNESEGLRWVGLSRSGFSLNYTPVAIADNLRPLLAATSMAWVFTSATIAVGNDFSHFVSSTGLEEPLTLSVPSPFDYAKHGRLLLPSGLPQPAAPGYTRAVIDVALPLLRASGGRAFLLFTSHRALREAAGILRESVAADYPLLVQGEAARSRLLERFAAEPRAVLLGAASFWEGVDIRGPALVLVLIDKLPFASPGDPLLKARLTAVKQGGGEPFRDFQLPQAILALKQGVGRLIRDFGDKGVVVVCDPRIRERGYGRKFLAALPPFRVIEDSADAAHFLSQL